MEMCDNVWNCNNHDDENMCRLTTIAFVYPSLKRLEPPSVIHFDGYGDIISTRSSSARPRERQTKMDIREWKSNASQTIETCPSELWLGTTKLVLITNLRKTKFLYFEDSTFHYGCFI